MTQPDPKALLIKMLEEDIKKLEEEERILKLKVYTVSFSLIIIGIILMVVGYIGIILMVVGYNI